MNKKIICNFGLFQVQSYRLPRRLNLVDLSETYSNNYSIIREYVKEYRPTPVKTSIDPNVTDLSYSPNSTVKVIKQQQKTLSEAETRTIILKY